LRNEFGVIGAQVNNWAGVQAPGQPPGVNDLTGNTLVGRQTIFSVDFRAHAPGNAEIRLSSSRDAIGRPAPAHNWWDSTTSGRYALYNPVTDRTGPLPHLTTFTNHAYYNTPLIEVGFTSDIIARVYRYSDGLEITRESQLNAGDRIFARVYGTNVNDNMNLILAVYDNGRFFTSYISEVNQTGDILLPSNTNRLTIKVFAWTTTGCMNPEFEPLVIGGQNL